MIIGIDASRANLRQRTGTEWYSYYLIQELKKIADPNDQVVLYVKSQPLPDLAKNLPANWQIKLLNWPLKLFWTQLRLAWEMMFNPPDVLFVPAHVLPLAMAKKNVTAIHDVGFLRYPELYGKLEKIYHIFALDWALKKASAILVPSEFTKNEILIFRPQAKAEKIKIVPLGVDLASYQKAPIDKINKTHAKYNLPGKYFLAVGRLERKKNVVNLIEAYEKMVERQPELAKIFLVLAGREGLGYTDIAAAKMRLKAGKIIELGYVAEEAMPALYSGAEALVFVSNYEGFGLPALQAMACGTPVIAANSSSLPEVIDGAGLLVDPADTEQIASAMQRLAIDQKLADELAKQGQLTAKNLSWRETAERTWQQLKK